MRKTRKQYKEVTKLPAAALTVAQYAEQRDCTTPYIYELIRKAKNIDFEIVIFKGINFIIPLT